VEKEARGVMRDDLARCDREIEEIEERPANYPAPAYLSAMGVNDWRVERRLIESERELRFCGEVSA
jgi:hypothetical protein